MNDGDRYRQNGPAHFHLSLKAINPGQVIVNLSGDSLR